VVWGIYVLRLTLQQPRLTNFEQITFNLSHLFIKLSYLAFYLRLTPDRKNQIIAYVAIGFVTAVGITFTTLSIFMCTPIQRGWDKSVPGTCVNDAGFLLSNAALNMAADVVVFAMPIPALWSLHREGDSVLLEFRRLDG
jgi:hypothetical protein